MSSKHDETVQSPPSPAPTQHRPDISNHKITQTPPLSLVSTQPLPVTSNHGLAQPSRRPQLPIPPPTDRTTAPIPLTKPLPPSQHNQTPPNVAQERQSQACAFTKETLNISLKVDMASSFTPNVAVTSHKSRDEGNRNVGPTIKALKPDVTPPPLKKQSQKPAQRPVWQVWLQKVWTGGK
jgi:hypothetical protein